MDFIPFLGVTYTSILVLAEPHQVEGFFVHQELAFCGSDGAQTDFLVIGIRDSGQQGFYL